MRDDVLCQVGGHVVKGAHQALDLLHELTAPRKKHGYLRCPYGVSPRA